MTQMNSAVAGAEQQSREHTRGGAYVTPPVDIFENDKELVIFAEMPGVSADNVDVRFERGELILHGRVKARPNSGRLLLQEYDARDFYRVFQVHEIIDINKIEASCKNGLLLVRLPKVSAAQPRKINVNAT